MLLLIQSIIHWYVVGKTVVGLAIVGVTVVSGRFARPRPLVVLQQLFGSLPHGPSSVLGTALQRAGAALATLLTRTR